MLRDEPGAEAVAACLPQAIISAVNLAEVLALLVSSGMDEELAWWHIAEVNCESVPFDEEQARIAGGLGKRVRPVSLSLGARACLALAIQRYATVYTTDAAWKNLALGIEVEVVR